MKLPNAERAVIPREKLRDYLTSTAHPIGRFKAAFFRRLGYTGENWQPRRTMTYRVTDCVVLKQDMPEHGLRPGDVGTVVETYESEGIEVEFVAPSGETRALLTLDAEDVRPVTAEDMLAVRPR